MSPAPLLFLRSSQMGSFRRLRVCTSPVCLSVCKSACLRVFVCSSLVSNPCADMITVKNFKKSIVVDLDVVLLSVRVCLCLCVQHVHLSSCLARLEASVSASAARRYRCCLKLKRLSPPRHATSPCSLFPHQLIFFSRPAPSSLKFHIQEHLRRSL